MCEVRSTRKMAKNQKEKEKEKENTMVSNKKRWTMMNPI
jgi:hypothetical protein